MKLFAIPVLAALLGQGDDPAKILKAMEEKIAKAEAVQVTFDAKIESTKFNGAMKGTLTAAGGNKAHAELTMEFFGKTQKHQTVSDGKMEVQILDGKPGKPKEADKNNRPLTTAALVRSGIAPLIILLGGGTQKVDPLDNFTVSEVKKLKVEKVGGRDAVAIEYQLNVKHDKSTAAATVWVDVQTHLPLKRVVRVGAGGENFTITENYSNLQLNPKLDAKLFQLP